MGSKSSSSTSSATSDNRAGAGNDSIVAGGSSTVYATTPEAFETAKQSLDFAEGTVSKGVDFATNTLDSGLNFGINALNLAANAIDSVGKASESSQNAALKSLDFANNYSRSDSNNIATKITDNLPLILAAGVAWSFFRK